jgi:hypothetical protein
MKNGKIIEYLRTLKVGFLKTSTILMFSSTSNVGKMEYFMQKNEVGIYLKLLQN